MWSVLDGVKIALPLRPMWVHHPGPKHAVSRPMSHPWPGISKTNANMSVGGGRKGSGGSVTADIGSKSTVEPRCDVDKLTICKQGPASVVFTHRAQTLSWGIYSRPHRRNTTVKQHSAIKFLSPHRQRSPGPPPACTACVARWFRSYSASLLSVRGSLNTTKTKRGGVIHHFVTLGCQSVTQRWWSD